MNGRYDELAERLEAIGEEIADLAIDELRGALRSGKGKPPSEKRLTQARRAIEKAAHLLRSADTDAPADDVTD